MEMTIAGKKFELRPRSWMMGYPDSRPLAESYEWRTVFTWNCHTNKRKWFVDTAEAGYVRTPVIAVFSPIPSRTHAERTASSARKKAEFLGFLGLSSHARLIENLNAYLGVHDFRLDFSAFSWLEPVASFVLRLETEFYWFIATTPDGEHSVFIGLPHQARLEADIVDYCDRDTFLELLESGELVGLDDIPVARGNRRSRTARRMALGGRIDELTRPRPVDPSVERLREERRQLLEND